MHDEPYFRRIAATTVIMAGVLNLAANVILSLAVDFKVELLSSPEEMLAAGLEPGAIDLFRWGEVVGIFGYCLLLIPAALYLWYWLKPQRPHLVTLYTVLGLIGIVLCVIESAIRASIWTPMMSAYPQLAEAQRELLRLVFTSFTDFAFESMYAVNSMLSGLWWLGVGLVLRSERRILGIATAIMGGAIFGAGVGWITRIDPLARLELFYFFEPFWAVWLGVVIWRRVEKVEEMAEVAMAA